MLTSNDIRAAFLDFFARNDHRVVASSPLVPHNDPTLLFTNAGMVQFKNVFTGQEKRDYARATTSQKCVRAGGKHNDLDNVGYTARHHTFFEMLGNFSFGDYFKERAIELAWTLLTKDFALAKDKLCVTVYHTDDEAANLWKKIAGLTDQRIIRIPTADNFWSMGDTGPCGPCSEIFYDHGDHIAGGPPGSADQDGDRFIEIWNLVFMQYEQLAPDNRQPLPRPSIDTGMGLERLAAVLQGKHDNYDTDTLRALIEASAQAIGSDADGSHKVSHRVIADHLRSSCFLMADGVLPSNEGRGYVLRRIMRRAMRHANIAGAREPVMWKLVPALVKQMGQAYPELARAEALIAETLKLEESRFLTMLDRGLKLLEDETKKLSSGADLPGEVAFKLYDTFGFPYDLTEDALRAQGRKVARAGFDAAMEKQRQDARAAWSGSGEAATEKLWFEIRDAVGASEFLGYSTEVADGKVVALVADGARVNELKAGQDGSVIVNQSPFYGESGGQMGDVGVIKSDAADFTVTDTHKKLGDLLVHHGKLAKGALKVGDVVELRVDGRRRSSLRAHHSATHLLHAALRRRLGPHVTQKGSMVAPDRLRFDFSHSKPIPTEELRVIERDVNRLVRRNAEVATRLMTPEAAVAEGAMALFGEKYGDEVRVVSMGIDDEIPTNDAKPYSTELCGGTHVSRTGDIGAFRIVAEGALASGVRRIEALTGEAADRWDEEQSARLAEAAGALKVAPADLATRVAVLAEDRRRLERELADAKRQLALSGSAASSGAASSGEIAKDVAGVKLVARKLDGVAAKDLKGMADDFKAKIGSGVVALVAVAEGKASVVVSVTDDLTGRFNAVDLVKAAAEALGGKGGGGRPAMAQAGGPDGDKADAALAAVEQAVAKVPA
ncbi:MAG TPA: alanine--tRNA ligase [Alphaproteobacteria bacterium]|jgi:alanyl-tRNA synthetase